ncbi:DUF799 domain-containing protein [Chitiniphilus eburneus]|uniref:DUF799 domain-containing protein n=1 Tax=Chitiniphilus eburneus TaxID=2571148 RepID=A0A4U0PUD2_9NEIS|nr:DUF799 domain-containing protein [Chitiniphilus eburneus]TJZ72071.1 hypothetical protein FAZ21_13145 [Chitiniphilus eburneus]
MAKLFKILACCAVLLFVTGCAAPKAGNTDYTAFKQSRPASILVLPPLNESPDVNATYAMLAQMTLPLAEAGYYVLPVALVDETFKQNGLNSASDIHGVDREKLREIFGADAVLYVTVTKYGSSYVVVDSVTEVAAKATLVDLRSGETLWAGAGRASSSEQSSGSSGGGWVGILVSAAIKQMTNHLSDASYGYAGITSVRMLSAGAPGRILYGPHSPRYGTD